MRLNWHDGNDFKYLGSLALPKPIPRIRSLIFRTKRDRGTLVFHNVESTLSFDSMVNDTEIVFTYERIQEEVKQILIHNRDLILSSLFLIVHFRLPANIENQQSYRIIVLCRVPLVVI